MYAAAGDILSRLLADFEPRELPPIDQWAEATRRLPGADDGGLSATRSGPLDLDLSPYVRQPLRDCAHPAVRDIAVLKSAQTGLSESLGLSALLYWAAVERQSALICYPTETTGRDFNARRLLPSVELCSATAGRVGRKTATELNVGGSLLFFAWSNSDATQKSNPVGRAVLDEIDAYPPDSGAHGNIADRGRTFPDRVLLRFSTPEDPEAPGYITQAYQQARHRHRFCVPCPITGRFFELWDFSLLEWAGGSSADPERVAADTWMRSPHIPVPRHLRETETAGRIRERHKAWMVRHGVWLRQGEEVESNGDILDTLDDRSPAELSESARRAGSGIGGTSSGPDGPDTTGGWLSRLDADWLREPPASPSSRARMLAGDGPDEAARDLIDRLGVRIVGGEDGAAGRIPPAATRSYRINELASLLSEGGWGDIAAEFVRHKGRPPQSFFKSRLAQAPGARGDIASVHALKALATPLDQGGFPVGHCPADAPLVHVGVDIQKDCVYWLAKAFGPPEVGPAIIDCGVIRRNESEQLYDIEQDLERLAWPVFGRDGPGVVWSGLWVDSGHWADDVYRLCERIRSRLPRGRACLAVKGSAQQRVPYTVSRVDDMPDPGRPGRRVPRPTPVPILLVHTDHFKTKNYAQMAAGDDPEELVSAEIAGLPHAARVRIAAADSGWARSDGRSARDLDDLLGQLSAERRVTRTVGRAPRLVWEKRREGIANHLFDCDVYATAGAHASGVDRLTADDLARVRAAEARAADETLGGPEMARRSVHRPRRTIVVGDI